MNRSFNYILKYTLVCFISISVYSCTFSKNINFSDHVKVSLRDVGHQLLIINNDTTSLVKPIIDLGDLKYKLEFEASLVIQPDSLVKIVKHSFEKAQLPQHYLTEVIECNTHEVAYSYKMNKTIEKGIVPCKGRVLDKACYSVTVQFIQISKDVSYSYLYLLGVAILIPFIVILYRKRSAKQFDTKHNYKKIGQFKFYPEQHKLVKEISEISLSKKECEILNIFISKPNQIVSRDELTKKVWEDKGVIVGRSLDTYISKLRKLLQDDTSIKLTNVHGVGYKLEINSQ